MKVKICGITNLEDALMCENYGAHALGFVFYSKSKRFIEQEQAKIIINKLSPFTIKVGVFVNESIEVINYIAHKIKLNVVQLHGEESKKTINSVLFPSIKGFRINTDFDFSILSEYKNCHYLLDSHSEKDYGGSGQKFDWNLIPKEIKNRIILSGGISSNNLEQIKEEVNPLAIDISSSLEITPGKKDEHKVKEFFSIYNQLRKN